MVPIAKPIIELKHRNSTATYELVFLASKLPAVGYKTFYIEQSDDDESILRPSASPKRTSSKTTIGNDVSVRFHI